MVGSVSKEGSVKSVNSKKGIEIIKAIPSKFEVPLKKKMDISGEFTVRAHPHDERFSIFYELKVGGYGSQMLQEQSSLHLIPSGVLISGRRPSNVTITGFDYKDYDMMEFIGELIKSGYNWQVENFAKGSFSLRSYHFIGANSSGKE